MEAKIAKLYNCESGKTVTIIAASGSESTSSFDRDMPRILTVSTVSRGAEEIERVGIKCGCVQRLWAFLW